MDLILLQKLGISIALGLFIGIERERLVVKRFGGVRTSALASLLGFLSYYLLEISVILFAAVLGVYFILILLSFYLNFVGWTKGNLRLSSKSSEEVGEKKNSDCNLSRGEEFSVAAELTMILVFLVGVLVSADRHLFAVLISLILVAAFQFKNYLHAFASSLSDEEIISTAKFLLISAIVLPLLPNMGFGPYDFFNPYTLWLIVVLISAISFASYVAVKVFGRSRGIVFTGFFGGIISSTALTLGFSGDSKRNLHVKNPYVVAVLIAGAAMFFRLMVEIVLLNSHILKFVALPLLVMAVLNCVMILFFLFWRDEEIQDKQLDAHLGAVKSPFRLIPALKFALFFTVILFFSRLSLDIFGSSGLFVTSFISGLLDVDAITVSLLTLSPEKISYPDAATAIILAAIANTLFKGGMFFVLGAAVPGRRVLLAFVLICISGVATLLL